jgi:PPE-repeat protein
MSGSVNLNSPSYLPMLFGGSTTGDSLLATLYGQAGPTPGSTNPIAALRQAQTGETKQVALIAAEPQVQRDIAQFTQALAAAKTPARLLANPAALKVLLTANGLGDQVPNTALATQALLSDPTKSNALINQLTDTRWLPVNKTYSFATKGLSVLNNPKTIAAIANGYAEVLWRKSLDQTTPGLSNALDFLNRASTIKTVDQVLGDPTFRAVLTTTLDIPKQIAFQTITAQEAAVATRIDLKKFQDPTYVKQFAQRYLIAESQNASQSAGTGSGSLTSLAVQSAGLVV